MSFDKIIEIQEARMQRELQVYKEIFKKVEYKINMSVAMGSVACIFKVPNFVFGLPTIDVAKTMEYILRKLNHRGFLAAQVDSDNI